MGLRREASAAGPAMDGPAMDMPAIDGPTDSRAGRADDGLSAPAVSSKLTLFVVLKGAAQGAGVWNILV